jgi:hypothetical protein
MTVLNQFKNRFRSENSGDVPTYVFDGTYEEYLKLKSLGKVFLNKNVFLIDRKILVA